MDLWAQRVGGRAEIRALQDTTPPTHSTVSAALAVLDRVVLLEHAGVAQPVALAEQIAAGQGWIDLQMRARLLRAELSRQSGDVAEAAVVAKQVNTWAAAHDDQLLLSRSHNTLSTVFRYIGDNAELLAQAVKAMAHTPSDVAAWVRVNHLVSLAIGLMLNNSVATARRRYQEALTLARETADPPVELMVLNNLAYGMHMAGAHQEAHAFAQKMRELQHRHEVTMFAPYLDTLARIAMQRGHHAEAERLLHPVLEEPAGPLVNDGDALAVCLLTLTESRRLRGALDEAQASLDWCRTVAGERGLSQAAALVMREQADLHAARGEYRDAYEELTRFQIASAALQDAEREIRAGVVHAIYEIEEAHLARDRYRELAWRDPLTGLHNRRLVDDELPALIGMAAQTGLPFSVALLDLDHFKQINDTCSHDTGDAVLRQVAALIVGSAPATASVVRLGGEEFLVILPECDSRSAVTRAERIRRSIAEHGWETLTRTLPVTVSIGVTTCRARTTPSAIMSLADQHMYAAKQAGRNRVVGDG
jgi:diguanylate cyclase (GGDEF)-like protein